MVDNASKDLIFWFFLALFLLSLFLLGWLLLPFLPILVIASVVAWSFNPIYLFIIRDKITPPFAALFTCILIFFILFVPIVLFAGILSSEAYNLYLMGRSAVVSGQLKSLLESSSLLENTNTLLANLNLELTIEDLNTGIMDLGKFIGKILFDHVTAISSNILNFVINFFFMLLVVFFLLLDGRRLVDFIIDLSPLPRDQDVILITKFKDMATAILIGNGLAGLIQGIAGGVVFAFFGLKSPFLWGVVMAFLAFLPIVGIGAVFLPASLFWFLRGHFFEGAFFIGFYALLSFGIEYLFKPKLVGDRVKMHTLMVFLSIIGGLKLFGLLGIIYGPLIATGFLTLVDIYHASYQKMVEPME